MTVLTDASFVLMVCAPASTVMLAEVAPTGKVKLSAKALCTFKTTPGLIKVLNPTFDT
jgi:hypothetical protein